MISEQNSFRSAATKALKKTIGFSGAVLVCTFNIAPGFAMVQSTNRFNQPESSLPSNVKLAQFGLIRDAIRTGEQIQRIEENERENEVDAERDEIRIEREKLRLERERLRLEQEQYQFEAKKAEDEEKRLAAERRRQYFNSLSPEEKKAYIEHQRALQLEREQQITEGIRASGEFFDMISDDPDTVIIFD
ncbi:hypothetical protein Pse7367_2007 [Thalassoporum mexicanum PCC 7367]|uniref:hypothetical protein n=1 Tax=Thalassoporum mexicanum TaxID=3457544 RepID=UPI00029F8B96|nr:hypothetical protein [Pseudanabaena sp. PCC 7367]AFY70280.1 hypothetical protein Pse7367_2007 [Pseudanabaena sp. PCC 7367]